MQTIGYVCITTNLPQTESNPNANLNPTNKHNAVVSIQLNIVFRYIHTGWP